MNHYAVADVTVTVAGDECNVDVRGFVRVESGPDGVLGASLEGEAEIWSGLDGWVGCDDSAFALSACDRERVIAALEECALEAVMEDACLDELDELEDA